MKILPYFLGFFLFVGHIALAQTTVNNEQMKIQELELKLENLNNLLEENKEYNLHLVENANRTIDFVNALVIFLTVLLTLAGLLGAYIASIARQRLRDIHETNKVLKDKIKFQRLLSEARFFATSGQRYEAEQRAIEMRKIKPDSMYGYAYQGMYLKTIGGYQEAYNAMKIAGEKLGVASLQIEFNLACYASLNKDPDTAFKHLNMVASINKDYLKKKLNDADLDNIRHDPRFADIKEKLN